jgi:hypothetical protein
MKQSKKTSDGMQNTSLRLEESQKIQLAAVEARSGLVPSAAIRHAVDMFLARYNEEGPLAVGLPDRQKAGIAKPKKARPDDCVTLPQSSPSPLPQNAKRTA